MDNACRTATPLQSGYRADPIARGKLDYRRDESASAADRRLANAVACHTNRLLGLLQRSSLGSGDAEDVVQDAFWVLARRMDNVPVRAERAFLMSTVLKLASDRRRSAWHRTTSQGYTSDDWESASRVNPETLYASQLERSRADRALFELSIEERDVFLLVDVEELSRQEAAHILGIAAGTVASRLRRARGRLSEVLQGIPASPSQSEVPVLLERKVQDQVYYTNDWGSDKTRMRFERRLVERGHGSLRQIGWYWYWPGLDATVFAYPEVFLGWKPWLGGKPSDLRFPIRLDQAKTLVVEYDVETRAMGTYNLAISTWLTQKSGWSLRPDVSAMSTELMVWPDFTSGAAPPGRFVDTLTVEGDRYELFKAPGYGKSYTPGSRGWTSLTLRGQGGSAKGRLPLGALLQALVRRRLIAEDQFVTCVELGNEIMGGAGTTFVQGFSVEI